ncbi:hypothetical protein C1Y27_31910, partial [Pseudomonas sp. GW704-F2]|uniref:hypothetical protein n=1 Tax=Pseudomonas sp. GW704-F2 TaxID=2070577 RepID=UPI000CBBFB34
PAEHVFVVVASSTLELPWQFGRRAISILAIMLAGFAFHGVYDHRQLAERDGGRVMFDPEDLVRARIDKGLVFVDTD